MASFWLVLRWMIRTIVEMDQGFDLSVKRNQKKLTVSRWKCYIQSRQMNTEIELGVRMNVSHFSVQHFIACSSMPTSFLSIVVIDLIFLPKKSEKPRNQNKKYRKKNQAGNV